MSAITITDYLARHAEAQPEQLALVCVERKATTQWSYQALLDKVMSLAGHFQHHAKIGDRALILMETGIEYVASFLACQYCGITAIPSFPPESTKPQHLARTIGIAKDASATLILTTSRFSDTVQALTSQTPDASMLSVDTLAPFDGKAERADVAPSDIAFLQYTSGSTAAPKGVMVSHENLIANERVICERMATTADDVMISWLPLFHDMGLIGGLLQPLFVGYPLVLTSPRYFMERPVRWLQLLSQYKGTISGGPDFSFRLCLERIKPQVMETLDLSHWRVAFSGAEPIRHDTLIDFAERFAVCGLDKQAIYPCYGLAEGTLMVTGSHAGQGAYVAAFDSEALAAGKATEVPSQDWRNTEQYRHQVGCGVVASEHFLRISDPHTQQRLDDGEIGEIWTAGPSIAVGYWQNEAATQATFVELDGKRWLRTGDVGYIYDGQLFISGREKDLIIMNGHNVYPQDIERIIEAELNFVRKGRVSAFPVPSTQTGEGIGLAIETSNSYRNSVAAEHTAEVIRNFVSTQFGHSPELVLLLDQGTLPKTSSGKLQRSACLKLYQRERLVPYGAFDSEALRNLTMAECNTEKWSDFELTIAQLWQQVLNYPVTSDKANFFSLGGNSLKAVRLIAAIQTQFDCQLDTTCLFTAPEFGAFCEFVKQNKAQLSTQIQLQPSQQTDYPLSAQQQRQLFLWQLQPDSNAYHIGAKTTLTGALSNAHIQQACSTVFERHPILRQQFIKSRDGMWRQSASSRGMVWCEEDLSLCTQDIQSQWIAQWYRTPFALAEGECFRVALIKVAPQQHRLLIAMHHIVGDAWSFELLLKQIAEAYQALEDGVETAQALPLLQYGDFAQWQQDWLESAEALQQKAYWLAQLSGDGDEELITPQYGNSLAEPASALLGERIEYRQVQQLQAFAHQQGASLYMLLLASLQVTFYRLYAKAKPRIGVPIANRRSAATQEMLGFFVNTQVISAHIQPAMSFTEVLAQVKQRALEAQQHQDYPFEKLVEVLNPERQLGKNPLFQFMLNHVEYQANPWGACTSLRAEGVEALNQQAQFDFSVDSKLFDDGHLDIELQYNSALFSDAQMQTFIQSWLTVLEHATQAPQKAIAELTTVKQPAELLALGQGKASSEATPQWLAQLAHHANTNPDATAIIYRDQNYSYSWLWQRAHAVARQLNTAGRDEELVVGILLPRTPEMLACTLGCLLAGAGYLPLDVNFPDAKLAFMLKDANCGKLISDGSKVNITCAGGVYTPAELFETLDSDNSNEISATNPHTVAYLNYTSGSTGTPKGIAIAHGALAKYIESAIDFIGLTVNDVVLQFATANFDAFVEQVFPTWTVGATVVLREDALWDAQTLYRQAKRHHISVMDLSAAYWRSIAASWAQQAKRDGALVLPHLRQVHSGGEAMSVSGIADWRVAGLADVKLLNTYGPTEIVVEASVFDCRTLGSSTTVPVGTAIQGRQLYILDSALQLVPHGEVGELYIGGDILARGYWQQSALTACKFIADPFRDDGARMYATGDLVRWQGDQLAYIGRRDHQVKIRGFRVELSEVESQLSKLPQVNHAVVQLREGQDTASLVAFVEAEHTCESELKQALQQHLPHYMIPDVIQVLDKLPLSDSGKLERHKLPNIESTLVEPLLSQQTGSALEQQLLQVFARHLQRDAIAMEQNFFDLGGHSLMLMAIFDELKQDHPSLVLTDLFQYPSIASLAAHLTSQSSTQVASSNAPNSKKQKQAMNAFAAKKRKSREA
ncbi:amino acid adenylation domain-containing protein [Pseudoalteromonas sp. J010]|uniref:non-ribosomal peptide synthetase n=1 Tax=Pseudoalteromonas sp. J010 TaxID=998465 RepID=UPI000F64CE6C|nr:non-ribosomal peptide synthetase [Pseudoalteromonas sp. J010]RRS09701.1 amino acid adenylation domain-containing protein [Pseudoalteromonas sp. J010]